MFVLSLELERFFWGGGEFSIYFFKIFGEEECKYLLYRDDKLRKVTFANFENLLKYFVELP